MIQGSSAQLNDKTGDIEEKLTFKSISDFVNESKYAQDVRLMSSVDNESSGLSPQRDPSQSSFRRIQGRFFTEAHTFALAV